MPTLLLFPSLFHISVYNSVRWIHINHISWWYIFIFSHYTTFDLGNPIISENKFISNINPHLAFCLNHLWYWEESSILLLLSHQSWLCDPREVTYPLGFILSQWYFKASEQSVESMFPTESSRSTFLFVQRTREISLWNLSQWQSSTMQCGDPLQTTGWSVHHEPP